MGNLYENVLNVSAYIALRMNMQCVMRILYFLLLIVDTLLIFNLVCNK